MNIKIQIGATYLLGLVACTLSGGPAIVLVLLMALVAMGAVALIRLEPELKLPAINLSRFMKRTENSIPQSAFVLGVGHQGKL